MKVRIVKCSKDTYWYIDYIGIVLDVDEVWHGGNKYYKLNDNSLRFLGIEDCEICFEDLMKRTIKNYENKS